MTPPDILATVQTLAMCGLFFRIGRVLEQHRSIFPRLEALEKELFPARGRTETKQVNFDETLR